MARLKILLPIDFGREVVTSYEFIQRLSELHTVELTFLHIYQMPVFPTTPLVGMDYYGPFYEEQKKAFEKRLEEINAMPYFEKCERTSYIENEAVDSVGTEIAKYASKHNFSLVVTSSKHRTPGEKFLMGTELLRIIRHSTVPVICLSEGTLPNIRKILFATDFAATNNQPLLRLLEWAEYLNAQVICATVSTPTYFSTQRVFAAHVQIFKEHLSAIAPEHYKWIEHYALYNDEQVVEGVVNAAEDWGADLIVVQTHGKTGLTRLLDGSIAEDVASSSHLPTMILRIV